MSYYQKYLKYKNKYLELRSKVHSENIETENILNKVIISVDEYQNSMNESHLYTVFEYKLQKLKYDTGEYEAEYPNTYIRKNITEDMYKNLTEELKKCYELSTTPSKNYVLKCGKRRT